jgi:hypothetical protein
VLKVGDIVWAKIKYQPYWPARIMAKTDVPAKTRVGNDEVVVKFFGKNDLAIASRQEVFDFIEFRESLESKARGVKKAVRLADECLNREKDTRGMGTRSKRH